jgi:hypothetical protein
MDRGARVNEWGHERQGWSRMNTFDKYNADDPEHHGRVRLPKVKEYYVRLRVVIQFDLGRGRASGRTL